MSDEPVGYIVFAEWEGEPGQMFFTTDRAEAHRVFDNLQRLDDKVVEHSDGAISGNTPVTLSNVYGNENELYEEIVMEAEDVRA
jgi:hypothetical protein